jgi:competence protein ComGC
MDCLVCNEKLNPGEKFCRACGGSGSRQIQQKDVLSLPVSISKETLRVRKTGFTFLEFLILVFILGILTAIAIPNHRKCYRPYPKIKRCYFNMRILLGAVEMYNMDKDDDINFIASGSYAHISDILVKEGYLKTHLSKPEPKCGYYMTEDGVFHCHEHGTASPPIRLESKK